MEPLNLWYIPENALEARVQEKKYTLAQLAFARGPVGFAPKGQRDYVFEEAKARAILDEAPEMDYEAQGFAKSWERIVEQNAGGFWDPKGDGLRLMKRTDLHGHFAELGLKLLADQVDEIKAALPKQGLDTNASSARKSAADAILTMFNRDTWNVVALGAMTGPDGMGEIISNALATRNAQELPSVTARRIKLFLADLGHEALASLTTAAVQAAVNNGTLKPSDLTSLLEEEDNDLEAFALRATAAAASVKQDGESPAGVTEMLDKVEELARDGVLNQFEAQAVRSRIKR